MERTSKPVGGKKPRSSSAAPAAAAASMKKARSLAAIASNPFEARENKRVRFDIMGRRVHGAARNVALARSKAVERRSHTLRAELQAEGKDNAFVDRRFGEYDTSIDAETRMLVRLQRERKRQLHAGARKTKFNLDDDGGAGGAASAGMQLTHFGKSLSDMGAFEDGPRPSGFGSDDEDEDATRNAEVTAAHFGGGDEPAPAWRGQRPVPAWMSKEGEADADRPKSYAEIMEEVIAKSKAAKAERAEEAAAQKRSYEWLEQNFASVSRLLHASNRAQAEPQAAEDPIAILQAALGSSGSRKDASAANAPAAALTHTPKVDAPAARSIGPSTETKPFAPAPPSTRAAPKATTDATDGFDALVTMLAGQSRAAAATDRTKTPEELAAEEAERLKELEALRIARMRGEGGDAGPSGDALEPIAPGGDDLGPDIRSSLTYRQRKRARAGASILDYAAKKSSDDSAGSDDSESGSEEESDVDEDASDDVSEVDDDDEDGDGGSEGPGEESEMDEDAFQDESDTALLQRARRAAATKGKHREAPNFTPGIAEELPYTPACPRTVQELQDMLRRHVMPLLHDRVAPTLSAGQKRPRNSTDAPPVSADGVRKASEAMSELLRRILACHSIKLKASNREVLSTLYDVLLQHICEVAEAHFGGSLTWQLEPIYAAVFALSQEAPLQAPASDLWRTLVKSCHKRVEEQIASGSLGDAPEHFRADDTAPACSASWFRRGEMLSAHLATAVFPTSDFRHSILTPLLLQLSQCMTQVPVVNEVDAAAALLHAGAALEMTSTARRYVPEAVATVTSCLRSFCTRSMDDVPVPLHATLPSWKPFAAQLQAACSASSLPALMSVPFSGDMQLPLRILPSAARGEVNDASEEMTRGSVLARCLLSACTLAAHIVSTLCPAPPATRKPVAALMPAHLMAAATAPAGNAARSALQALGVAGGNVCLFSSLPAPLPCAAEILDDIINPLAVLGTELAGARSVTRIHARITEVLAAAVAARNAVGSIRGPMKTFEMSTAPRAVKQFAPLLEDIGLSKRAMPSGAKHADDAAEEAAKMREELRRLQRAKKRELRGAARELRLDRAFVVRETDKVVAARDVERSAKFREVMSSLETQAAESKRTAKKTASVGADIATRLANTGKTKADRLAIKSHSRTVSSGAK